jgi:hypothetical protein
MQKYIISRNLTLCPPYVLWTSNIWDVACVLLQCRWEYDYLSVEMERRYIVSCFGYGVDDSFRETIVSGKMLGRYRSLEGRIAWRAG